MKNGEGQKKGHYLRNHFFKIKGRNGVN